MLIRYTGPKTTKVIEYNSQTFIFNPTAEVKDPLVLKFLINADMKGLFVVVDSGASVPRKVESSLPGASGNDSGDKDMVSKTPELTKKGARAKKKK